jgi:hypothetical protein
MQKTIDEMGKGWKDKLPDALWAYQNAYKTPIGMSPFNLYMEKHVICLLNWSSGPIRQSRNGIWIFT